MGATGQHDSEIESPGRGAVRIDDLDIDALDQNVDVLSEVGGPARNGLRDEIMRLADDESGTAVLGADDAARQPEPPPRALVIDDEPQNRAYYTAVFTELAWTVDCAATAAEGRTAFEHGSYDVVLADVRLPDGNGYETVRKIRAIDPGRSYIVLMSTDPQMVESDRVVDVGADLALVGPIAPNQLDTVLKARHTGARHLTKPPVGRTHEAVAPEASSSPPVVSVRVFGGLALAGTDGWHPVPQGRHSELLGALLAHSPETLSTDALGEEAWDNGSPTSGSIYTAVSRLRSWLTSIGRSDLIESHPHGYRVALDLREVDSGVFRDMVRALPPTDDVTGHIAAAELALETAVGVPYLGGQGPMINSERVRLTETRAVLQQHLAATYMVSGQPADAITLMRDLAQCELWRESAWALLAVALFHCSRQRDALTTFRQARRLLIETAGVKPGPVLCEAEQLVLEHSPRLNDAEYIHSLPS